MRGLFHHGSSPQRVARPRLRDPWPGKQEWKPPAANFKKREQGNVGVFVALSMATIIFFVALAVDLGFLVMEKEEHQVITEAAAESGIRVLHTDPDHAFEKVCESLLNNLADEETVPFEVLYNDYFHPGFYDFKDSYSDFEHYKNFASQRHGEVPEGEHLNAIAIIDYPKRVETIKTKSAGQTTGQVRASAVAYGKNYSFLALGEGADAMKYYGWENGYSNYQNCLIGSNGGIIFDGTETFDSRTLVEAVGPVQNRSGSGTPDVRINTAAEISLPDIDWAKLRQKAESNGKVYDPESWTSTWQTDEYGNAYQRKTSGWSPNITVTYSFVPMGENLDNGAGDGDHQGRTYFIDVPETLPLGVSAMTVALYNSQPYATKWARKFWNCTIAARGNMSTFPTDSAYTNTGIQFGDYDNYGENGLVYLYCQRFYRWYTRYGGTTLISIPKGTIIRCEEDFTMYSQYNLSYWGQPETYYLKVLADTMYLYSPTWRKNAIVFVGNFGAPDIFRLGSLE